MLLLKFLVTGAVAELVIIERSTSEVSRCYRHLLDTCTAPE
jgi:hypothetical protein